MKLYNAWGFYEGGRKSQEVFGMIDRILISYYQTLRSSDPSFLEKSISGKDLFIDCGAYSAWTSGITITLEEYMAFLESKGLKDRLYVNLDNINDPIETRRNQKKMEANGFHPLPVFHFGEAFDFLHGYLKDYDYICLGIAGNQNTIKGRIYLDACFSIIREYWPKRIHGFALTGQDHLLRYPFYSVDSSSALTAAGYGRIFSTKRGKLSSRSYREPKTGAKYFDCVDQGHSRRSDRAINNVKEILKLEKYINEVWERRGISWDDQGRYIDHPHRSIGAESLESQ